VQGAAAAVEKGVFAPVPPEDKHTSACRKSISIMLKQVIHKAHPRIHRPHASPRQLHPHFPILLEQQAGRASVCWSDLQYWCDYKEKKELGRGK